MVASRVLIDAQGRPMLGRPVGGAPGGAARVQTEACQDPQCGCGGAGGCCDQCPDARGVCVPTGAPPAVGYAMRMRVQTSIFAESPSASDSLGWTENRLLSALSPSCGIMQRSGEVLSPISSEGVQLQLFGTSSLFGLCASSPSLPSFWPHRDFSQYRAVCPDVTRLLGINYKGVPTHSQFWSRPPVWMHMGLQLRRMPSGLGAHWSIGDMPDVEIGVIVTGTASPRIGIGLFTGAPCSHDDLGREVARYHRAETSVSVSSTSLGQRCISGVKGVFEIDLSYDRVFGGGSTSGPFTTVWSGEIEISLEAVGVCPASESAGLRDVSPEVAAAVVARADARGARASGIPQGMLPENAFPCNGCSG